MKVAWLAPYPVQLLEPELELARRPATFHPCSWIVHLAPALARLPGVELHLVSESQFVTRSQSVLKGAIHFHVIKSGIPFTHRGFPPWFPVEPLLGFKPNSRRINAALREIKPDLVHGHGTEAGFGRAAIDSGKPCVISIQGIIAEYLKTNPDIWFRCVTPCERWQVSKALNFTCRTAFDSGFVRSINPAARIFNLQEAMAPLFFSNAWQPEQRPYLLFVGAVCERKGVPLLIEAMPRIVEQSPEILLRIVGPGPAEFINGLKQRATQLGVAGRVIFEGQKTADAIATLHRGCRAYVLPTRNDNSPNTLAEAMVSGIPIVASRVGGIPSMVEHGKTGLLFEGGNLESLLSNLGRVLSDETLSRSLADRARAVARQRHHPDSVAAETLAAYRTILEHT